MSSGPFIDRPKAEKQTEIFRMYLEEHGVTDALTRILAELNAAPPGERPENPIAFICERLPGARLGSLCNKALQNAVIDYKAKVLTLSEENKKLVERLKVLEKENEESKHHITMLEKKL